MSLHDKGDLLIICYSDRGEVVDGQSPANNNDSPNPPYPSFPRPEVRRSVSVYNNPVDGTPATTLTQAQEAQQEHGNNAYLQFMKPKFTRAPIKEAGRVAYLGESSNLTLLVQDKAGTTDVVHYPLPDSFGSGGRGRPLDLDDTEMEILGRRGAFLLPPKALCDELVDAYFEWVAPIVPVINRNRFMRQYRDPDNPPSILLLQAMLLAGSRVCNSQALMDANHSTTPAALTFYKRAKALYDANYEDDRVTIVQALVLMGWYWEGPEDVTKNVFYWSRVATIVAQGSGMHRSVEGSQLSKADKKLWKRIWWTLFTRDRSVAVALGRPIHINTDDSDVEMVCEEDFIEDEDGQSSQYPPNPLHVQFFLQYVKLCEIMGLVLSQQYSVAAKARRQNAIDLTHSDMALADWLSNCPKTVYWQADRYEFWAALLHSNYYTTLCLLHRAHMPPATSQNKYTGLPEENYPSRNIAFQAAAMITTIIENLTTHGEIQYAPAFIVYSLFSALIMHVYQNRSSNPSVVTATQERMRICMNALNDVSRVWLVAKMVYTLFQSILGNKIMEERLQKAAGRKHKKMTETFNQLHQFQAAQQQQMKREEQLQQHQPNGKRKYDDMSLDFNVGTPAPQESYERSRPASPTLPPSQLRQGSNTMPAPPIITSPSARQVHHHDTFMGGSSSRPHTRPPTPFNPSFSVPATPPDLYLVTRDEPNLSQSIWENFQPDQLFPEGHAAFMPQFSPPQNHGNLDPNLLSHMSMPAPQQSQTTPNMSHRSMGGLLGTSPQPPHLGIPGMHTEGAGYSDQQWQSPGTFAVNGANGHLDKHSPSDTWSNSSAQNIPAAPTTLNVEEW